MTKNGVKRLVRRIEDLEDEAALARIHSEALKVENDALRLRISCLENDLTGKLICIHSRLDATESFACNLMGDTLAEFHDGEDHVARFNRAGKMLDGLKNSFAHCRLEKLESENPGLAAKLAEQVPTPKEFL